MPIRPELRKHYGRAWRTQIRPQALARAFWECERCALPDRPAGLKSALDVAHLDGDPANRDDVNLACLCHRCHHAHDYPAWAAQYRAWLVRRRELRIEQLDSERPILAYLKEQITCHQQIH